MIEALCSATHPWWSWAIFIGLILIFLWLDLAVFHKKTHSVSVKEALIWSGVWFGIAMVFNIILWLQCGTEPGLQFLTGYLVEKSLSIDNLFIILLIFSSFSIAPKYQHRILFWGIMGALIMRGLLIIVGSALIERFAWIFYIFGAFLVFTGIKMFFETEEKFDQESHWFVRWIKKIVPVAKHDEGQKFFVQEKGKWAVTTLFLALLVVEFTDLIFAFDSIPAIFAITTDPFIVFTSNVFAILGLRSLYFVISKAHELFAYLKVGLAIILTFIGVKLLIKEFYHMPLIFSLGVVLGILAMSIGISIFWPPNKEKEFKKRKKR